MLATPLAAHQQHECSHSPKVQYYALAVALRPDHGGRTAHGGAVCGTEGGPDICDLVHDDIRGIHAAGTEKL